MVLFFTWKWELGGGIILSYASKHLDEVKRLNKSEPEFIQAVSEVLPSLEVVLDKNPQYESAGILERITEPERQFKFRVAWTDDNGKVLGIDNARDLLERIPNKITDTMGIIADVNLLYEGELEYLQIVVDKYPSLISFRGKYYYRSGSTMREITGKEL